MSKRYLVDIDLSRNQIQNAVFQVLASAPSTPVAGQFYYNSTTGKFEYRGASSWIDPTDRTHHTGTQLANTISNFDTQVRTNRLDQMAVPTAPVSLNNQRITNLATPTADTDAATKGYVDSAINGTDWKNSVRVATTANITLSGLQTIDGVSVLAGESVLVKDQTTANQNGIYLAQSGAWTRRADADVNAEVTSGLSVMVTEGTVNGDTQWRLITNDPITVGTTALVFTQIGAGVSYTQGAGIVIAGNVISVDTAVVSRKFAQTIGTGAATSIAVNHGLNTLDVQVQIYDIATGETVECDVIRNSVSQVTLGFSVAPASNSLRVVVVG